MEEKIKQPHLEPIKRLWPRRGRELAGAPRHEHAIPGLLADDAALVVQDSSQAQGALGARFGVAAAGNGDKLQRLGAHCAALVRRRHLFVESGEQSRLRVPLRARTTRNSKRTRADKEGKESEVDRLQSPSKAIDLPTGSEKWNEG